MTLRKAARVSTLLAFLLFTALFIFKIAIENGAVSPPGMTSFGGSASFEMSRKNYASSKQGGDFPAAPPDSQKYEKIATIGEATPSFDEDRAKIEALIAADAGLTQYEQQQGLDGHRILQLGIGIPPAKFDSFIGDARKIAKVTHLSITKTDKTNEYRQLRAKRETLEKARKALTEMAGSGGSVDERLKVQAQLTEVEEKIQDLGVSLGDFNAENEFCTVKLTLAEIATARRLSLTVRAFGAFTWAVEYFLLLAAGLLLLALALWIGMLALGALVSAGKRLGGE